jgi:DNA (cytosine-5)-methyltransferase 1
VNVLDLFSGIGGFSLGLESTGFFKTVAFVEKDKFCQKVLQKNFPNIPIEDEVRNVKGERFKADVITGGFPCQPFSVAGKRRGTEDDRFLWDETIRIVSEQKPKWFIGENVEGIINIQDGLVFRQIHDDLESEGFEVQSLVIPASGVGAWHQRKRVWIIGNYVPHANNKGTNEIKSSDGSENKISEKYRQKFGSIWEFNGAINKNVSNSTPINLWNANSTSIESSINRQREGKFRRASSRRQQCQESWWQTQSSLCGVPNGISYELDKDRANRIKALGNSIVPQIAREIGKAIMEAELG